MHGQQNIKKVSIGGLTSFLVYSKQYIREISTRLKDLSFLRIASQFSFFMLRRNNLYEGFNLIPVKNRYPKLS